MMHLVMIQTDGEKMNYSLHELLCKAIHEGDVEAQRELEDHVQDILVVGE
jgi:hypothetical protein